MAYTYDFEDGWRIRDRAGYSADDEVSKATVFALANGYMGVRGAPEGLPPTLPGVMGHTINGLYDSPTGDILDREMINLPAWTPLALEVDGHLLGVDSPLLEDYVRTLDMRSGLLLQQARWRTPEGVTVTLESERLVSMAQLHLGAIRWQLQADAPCTVTVRSAVDADVNNRFAGTHFATVDVLPEGIAITTIQERYRAAVLTTLALEGGSDIRRERTATDRRVEQVRTFRLAAGEPVALTKLVAVYDSRFSEGDPVDLARRELETAQAAGYAAIRAMHSAAWEALWASSDVVIAGDEGAQIAIRFCLFHLLANLPHSDRVSVSARGLQGQDYWGSIFWDCDIYVLPFYIYTQPDYARRSLLYRYHTLDGARRKAQGLGFRGAYYAWQSQETGDETCALYVFTDPRTGQKLRSYFADEQIHISADVVYALWQYVRATGDRTFLRGYGLEIIGEVARFFVSRAIWNEAAGRYELRTVLGPDEYHERVDNNAYTNALAQDCLRIALAALEQTRADDPAAYATVCARLGLDADEIALWERVAERLYVPEPDPQTGVIPQFDGYFALEDAPPDQVRARLAHPDLHPGGPHGPFQATQAIKQADVVLLMYLWRDRYPEAIKRANWDYYEPRTAHDSSLSPMAYALVAADVGRTEWAYRYFLHTAMMDLLGTGPHWNLGVHTAAMGGAWLAIVHGFCRLDLREDGVYLTGWPVLPAAWREVSFSFLWHGRRVRFSTDGQVTTLIAEDEPVPVIYPGGQAVLEPGWAFFLPGRGNRDSQFADPD
ncbi:MAG: glycoside hydrolase family 65 protein [Anaerolineae bacterium]|nr:glycoside hydrolase family 65 protein [Anaerolineae bacterium]